MWREYGDTNLLIVAGNGRGGANGLADFWAKEQEKGVTHLALNLKPTQRPADEVLTELAECVLSRF
ncbi:hypothetical protein [Mannheimia varigena]|uniref:hypothetical protein n=1 Tax=Mannheimia varigena TaxID=85404 RepID=UPI001F460428|nr:hypothetical protein [Mannheimia varigena]